MDSLLWIRRMASDIRILMSTVFILWHCIFCLAWGIEFVTTTWKNEQIWFSPFHSIRKPSYYVPSQSLQGGSHQLGLPVLRIAYYVLAWGSSWCIFRLFSSLLRVKKIKKWLAVWWPTLFKLQFNLDHWIRTSSMQEFSISLGASDDKSPCVART